MLGTSRDRLFAMLVATLGVSAACNREGDAPPVTAREVPPWSDAAVAAPSDLATDAGAATTIASAAPESAVDAAPVASASANAAADAGASAPVEPLAWDSAAQLGWLVAGAPVSPTAPAPRGPSPPKPPAGLAGIGSTGSGEQAACGASSRIARPVATVQLLVAPRPGLAAADATRATSTIAHARARVAACVRAMVANDPSPFSKRLVVQARTTGGGRRASVTVSSALSSQAAVACITTVLGQELGGDDKPATLTFGIDVVVTQK